VTYSVVSFHSSGGTPTDRAQYPRQGVHPSAACMPPRSPRCN